MINLNAFHDKVMVIIDESTVLGKRLKRLLDEVILRLPNEEQFQMPGIILFYQRTQAIEFWQWWPNAMPQYYGIEPDLTPLNRDGCCTRNIAGTIDMSHYVITIILDQLHEHSDDYIKGLIVHELSEMSYMWRLFQKELPNLKKMEPQAAQVRSSQLGKMGSPKGSMGWYEHESAVDNEAIRLGFALAIATLETGTAGYSEVS